LVVLKQAEATLGEIGMLMITRRFDSDNLAQRKREESQLMPMGQRLT